MTAPHLIEEAAATLRAAGWSADITRDRSNRHLWRLKAQHDLSGGAATVTYDDRHPQAAQVTILTHAGYACLGETAPSVGLAAQWIVNVLRVDEAAAQSRKRNAERASRNANPWTSLSKRIHKSLALRAAQPRSAAASADHTRSQYHVRYKRTLSGKGLKALLDCCQDAPLLERQHQGREVVRVQYDGNDVIAVLSPGRTYLVTVLRPFEYVTLRIARNLLDRPARPVACSTMNPGHRIDWPGINTATASFTFPVRPHITANFSGA